MKTVVMYVGDMPAEQRLKSFRWTISYLENEGVEILENTSDSLMVIQTPKTYIMFIDDLRKIEGRLFDEIFGNVPEKFAIARLKGPRAGRFSGSLIDYVVRCEYSRTE